MSSDGQPSRFQWPCDPADLATSSSANCRRAVGTQRMQAQGCASDGLAPPSPDVAVHLPRPARSPDSSDDRRAAMLDRIPKTSPCGTAQSAASSRCSSASGSSSGMASSCRSTKRRSLTDMSPSARMTPEALEHRGLGIPWQRVSGLCTLNVQSGEALENARTLCLLPTPELVHVPRNELQDEESAKARGNSPSAGPLHSPPLSITRGSDARGRSRGRPQRSPSGGEASPSPEQLSPGSMQRRFSDRVERASLCQSPSGVGRFASTFPASPTSPSSPAIRTFASASPEPEASRSQDVGPPVGPQRTPERAACSRDGVAPPTQSQETAPDSICGAHVGAAQEVTTSHGFIAALPRAREAAPGLGTAMPVARVQGTAPAFSCAAPFGATAGLGCSAPSAGAPQAIAASAGTAHIAGVHTHHQPHPAPRPISRRSPPVCNRPDERAATCVLAPAQPMTGSGEQARPICQRQASLGRGPLVASARPGTVAAEGGASSQSRGIVAEVLSKGVFGTAHSINEQPRRLVGTVSRIEAVPVNAVQERPRAQSIGAVRALPEEHTNSMQWRPGHQGGSCGDWVQAGPPVEGSVQRRPDHQGGQCREGMQARLFQERASNANGRFGQHAVKAAWSWAPPATSIVRKENVEPPTVVASVVGPIVPDGAAMAASTTLSSGMPDGNSSVKPLRFAQATRAGASTGAALGYSGPSFDLPEGPPPARRPMTARGSAVVATTPRVGGGAPPQSSSSGCAPVSVGSSHVGGGAAAAVLNRSNSRSPRSHRPNTGAWR